MRLAWLLFLVGLALARVDITVPECLSMSVERRGERLHFAAEFDLSDSTGVESLVPVLGFEPYVDGRLAMRGTCGNIASSTSAQNLVEASAVSRGSYNSLITQHNWTKTVDAAGISTMSLEIAPAALAECLNSQATPVLHDGAGIFYISLVRLVRAGEDYSDYSVYTQPHHFRLSADGEVESVTPMRWMFALAWVSNTWTADGNVVMEFVSNLTSTAQSQGAFIGNAEITSGGGDGLRLVAISECDAAVPQYCAQQWLFMSEGAPSGRYRIAAHMTERDFGPSSTFSALLELDVAPNEQHSARSGSVDVRAFVDEAMQLPYLASALNGSVLRDGETVCMLLQDNDGHAIRARAARVCSSASGTLRSESGAPDSGCNTPGLDDIIEAIIFDTDDGFVSRTMQPVIKQLESVAHQAFCFSALKLSENNHVVEIEYEEPSQPGVFGRQLQSFGYDNENCHHQMYIECQPDYGWNRGCSCCKSYKQPTHYENADLIWLAFILFLVIVGAAACYTGSDCFHGAPYWGYGGTTQQQQNNTTVHQHQETNHHNYYAAEHHDYEIDMNDAAHLHTPRRRNI